MKTVLDDHEIYKMVMREPIGIGNSLLDDLVTKLGKNDFKYLSQEFDDKLSDLVKQ